MHRDVRRALLRRRTVARTEFRRRTKTIDQVTVPLRPPPLPRRHRPLCLRVTVRPVARTDAHRRMQ